jgi:hypothetical protein
MLSPPTNLTVSDSSTEDQLTIDWDEASNALSYFIYRGQATGTIKNDYAQIANVPAPPFTDSGLEDGEEFYYRVSSSDDPIPVTDGLAAWYRFEDSSNTAVDATARLGVGADQTAFDGIVNGATHLSNGGVQDSKTGKNPSGAYRFDGVDDFIDIGDVFGFSSSKDFTICFWVKKEPVSGNPRIVGRDTDNSNYGFLIDNFFKNDEGVVFRANGNQFSLGPDSTVTNQYFHVALSNSNGTQQGYINGSNTVSGNLTWSGNTGFPFRFGTAADETKFFDGTLDDPRMYTQRLGASKIQRIYDNGDPS